jgi:hypothetical protein
MNQVKVTLRLTVSQSVTLGVEPNLGLMTIYLLVWQLRSCFCGGALSDERTGLSFVYAAGSSQRSLSRVRVPWYSRPYFTVSDLRLPISSPLTTRRVTVEVFDPASTRATLVSSFCNFGANRIESTTSNSSSLVVRLSVAADTSLASRCLAMDYSGFQASCHDIFVGF